MADGSPVFAVYFPENLPNSPREVFSSVKEAAKVANSAEGKSNGARFKRFNTPKEALDFISGGPGDFCVSPLARPSSSRLPQPRTSTPLSSEVASEPTIPHDSITRVQFTALKKTIENDDLEKFKKLVTENPRYIVNTSGDTATILMEGCRYNGLHIAAKSGRHSIASSLLSHVSDVDFLARCYGTNSEDAAFRRPNIVSSYLNTPDKGNCDVPLHFAAKFGHVEVVRVLVLEAACDKGAKNKEGLTPLEVVCSRYHGEDKAQRKHEIDLLLNGCFVALYRSRDNSQSAKIVVTENYPHRQLNMENSSSVSGCLVPLYSLAACAGPFHNKESGQHFHHRWACEGKDLKLTDSDKGYERVGRGLVAEMERDRNEKGAGDGESIGWAEKWFFLGDGLVNFDSDEDLSRLNDHLRKIRVRRGQADAAEGADSVRVKLNFDDDEAEPVPPQCPSTSTASLSGGLSEGAALPSPICSDTDEVFEDAIDHILPADPSQSSVSSSPSVNPDDSITSFTERFAALRLESPSIIDKSVKSPLLLRTISGEDAFDDSSFCTPPATPPPLFLLDQPTKADSDLFSALSRVSPDRLVRFPFVHSFFDKLSRLEMRQRAAWPGTDSPRRYRSPRILA